MKILVNALSVTNVSGRHVLLGHLSRLAEWTEGEHEYLVLHHAANIDIVRDLGLHVMWLECPASTSGWVGRSLWEWVALPRLIAAKGIDALFTPAGITYAGISVPQVSFAQNPWCLVPKAHAGLKNQFKAAFQRRAYKRAMRRAAVMVFNSSFMQRVYQQNAGFTEKLSHIIYQGVDEITFRAADQLRESVKRKSYQIVSVSAMAPHKGVETLIEAVRLLRCEMNIPATLVLVGGWPDANYEGRIRQQVLDAHLDGAVEFRGHVTDSELHRSYAEARIFCLMSWCESFGIPAIEAQAFGTPVVSANCCAMPEIEGEGGLYAEPGDARGCAAAMQKLLTDDNVWAAYSRNASENAQRFHWDECSRPFVEVFRAMT